MRRTVWEEDKRQQESEEEALAFMGPLVEDPVYDYDEEEAYRHVEGELERAYDLGCIRLGLQQDR